VFESFFPLFSKIPKNLSGERLEGNPARSQLYSSLCSNDFLPFRASTACPAPATQLTRFLGLSATTSAPEQEEKPAVPGAPLAPKETARRDVQSQEATFVTKGCGRRKEKGKRRGQKILI
jgi:hypothetical protein